MYDISKVITFIETEWRLPRVVGEERQELLFNGYRVSDLQDEKNCGDVFHNNVNILNTTENEW